VILEVAVLDVKKGMEASFEDAFAKDHEIISATKGFISLQLQRCLENDSRYILLVNWETVEAHTETFRKSEAYQNWKQMLHHFYEPFPTVEHYRSLIEK
jgi:heme-degrading monooxygenase HmoA